MIHNYDKLYIINDNNYNVLTWMILTMQFQSCVVFQSWFASLYVNQRNLSSSRTVSLEQQPKFFIESATKFFIESAMCLELLVENTRQNWNMTKSFISDFFSCLPSRNNWVREGDNFLMRWMHANFLSRHGSEAASCFSCFHSSKMYFPMFGNIAFVVLEGGKSSWLDDRYHALL